MKRQPKFGQCANKKGTLTIDLKVGRQSYIMEWNRSSDGDGSVSITEACSHAGDPEDENECSHETYDYVDLTNSITGLSCEEQAIAATYVAKYRAWAKFKPGMVVTYGSIVEVGCDYAHLNEGVARCLGYRITFVRVKP